VKKCIPALILITPTAAAREWLPIIAGHFHRESGYSIANVVEKNVADKNALQV
jgi:hypothetical protein